MYALFTSESVTEGHPDKVCDQISDAVLDSLLAQDPYSRCACEVTAQPGKISVMGEITTRAEVDYEAIVRKTLKEVGYDHYAEHAEVSVAIHNQSPDINGAVTKDNDELGAGDQGIMFGYANNETEQLMPASFAVANELAFELANMRKSGKYPWIKSDGKTQVTLRYDHRVPIGVECVVVSTQHSENVDREYIEKILTQDLIIPVLNRFKLDYKDCKFLINPSGRFVLGGPDADTGLTGRKIVVDTYGGAGHHGGGAFSGKDPSKVDRSAAYQARQIAKTIVASGAATKCEVELAYAIGVPQPVSVFVETFSSGKVPGDVLCKWVRENWDLRPSKIIEKLGLRKPIYRQLAAYGHFGRKDVELPWEYVDPSKVESLRKLF